MKAISLRKIILSLLITGYGFTLSAQQSELSRVEPPNWWAGFRNHSLQLMVYGKNISLAEVSCEATGTRKPDLFTVHKVQSPNYLFIDLDWKKQVIPGTLKLIFREGGREIATYNYIFKQRQPGSASRKGFDASDAIYLVMPDRFSDGDPANNSYPGMAEQADRSNPDGRHGGDIAGIRNHLDYLKDLGATAIWITPLLENNMQKYSYHGYSTTDYYRIDPRFGTNDDYLALSRELHARGMKLIMDMVFNHCGSNHWWMNDLPSPDWINQWPEFTRTSYRAGTVSDSHVSAFDRNIYQKGWFDRTMPDLNQENPFLATYLIQNSIWWIEEAGLDGIRSDTHPYPFKEFTAEWMKRVSEEYPDFNTVGECWVTQPAGIAYWQKDSHNADGYNSNLPSVFDFAMYDALRLGFTEKDGWSNGISRLYEIISQDYNYPDPSKIVVFADNHDVERYLSTQNGSAANLRMALAFIMTSRGIPQVYYGTEVLVTRGSGDGDGRKRLDFPGGWSSDSVNAFTPEGRTPAQEEMYRYTRNLMRWRDTTEIIHSGKLTHFLPVDGVYVYFRHKGDKVVMVALNNNEKDARTLEWKRYEEFLSRFTHGREILSGNLIPDLSKIAVPPKSAIIVELMN